MGRRTKITYSPTRQRFHYWFDRRIKWEKRKASQTQRIALAIAIDQERAWLYRDPFVRAAMS